MDVSIINAFTYRSMTAGYVKRSEVPKDQLADEIFRPSACVPTDPRSVYTLGPGEWCPEESFAWSFDMYSLLACSREAVPNP